MSFLYDADKVMPINDYMRAIISGASREAAFIAMVASGKASQMKSTWAVEAAARAFFPTIAEGRKYDGTGASTVPFTLEGLCQIFRSEGWGVTQIAESTDSAHDGGGSGKSPADQKANDAINLMTSMERVLLGDGECFVGSKDVAYKTRGAFNWLLASAHGVSGVSEIPAELRPAAAQNVATTDAAPFTEEMLEAALTSCYTKRNGQVMLTGLVGIKLKQRMSYFARKVATVANVTDKLNPAEQKRKELENVVDIFRYDAGEIKVMVQSNLLHEQAGNMLPTAGTMDSGIFVDLPMWSIDYMRPIAHKPLPDMGQGQSGFHECVARLTCKNPAWQFFVKHGAAA